MDVETKRWDEGRQRILNAHDVPERRAQRDARPPIPVRARLVWPSTGEEWVDTECIAWTGRLVLVLVEDPRSRLRGAWLAPADVERR